MNFAGHYRYFTQEGGKGAECLKEPWVCGWVIDKLTGYLVSELPKDNDGSNVYASTGGNGTPVGLTFEVDAYKDSSMFLVTGQAIPSIQNINNDNLVCKSSVYNFTDNKFVKLTESADGCQTDE